VPRARAWPAIAVPGVLANGSEDPDGVLSE